MSLVGIDPQDPTPSARREFQQAQGPASPGASQYPILVFANKLAGGSEAVETIGAALDSIDDCGVRFGLRSEMYTLVREIYRHDPDALVFCNAVAEPSSSPTQASCTFTFVGTAADTTTVDVFWAGYQTSFVINSGDLIATMATNLSNAINNAMGGTWPMAASPAAGVVTVTFSQEGDRGTFYLTPIRVVPRKPTSAITTTITKSAVTNGSGTDTETLALAAAATAGEFRIHVSAKYVTSAPTATDGGVGEHCTAISTQNLPINGKSQVVIFGLVGTQTQGTTVTTSSATNNGYAYFIRQKNSDFAPGMIAAAVAGAARFQWLQYPAFNMIGYTNDAATPFFVPPQFTKADVASASEIKADLNNGVSTIVQDQTGRTKLVRLITSRSLSSSGQNDYRVREGHIPIVDFAYWDAFFPIWNTKKQPNVANDPPKGQKPVPLVTYPKSVAGWMEALARDMAGPNPLGLYPGPLLDPTNIEAIASSIATAKIAGGISGQIDLQAVEHLVKSETKIRDVTAAQ